MRNQSVDLPQVLGTGVLYNGTGNPFCLVSSGSEPGRAHVVTYLLRGRFTCDCRRYNFCGHCRHIDAVVALHRHLERVEYAERETTPTATVREDVVRRAPTASRGTHGAHPGDTAMPRRNNRPFSLLK